MVNTEDMTAGASTLIFAFAMSCPVWISVTSPTSWFLAPTFIVVPP